jgi:hypothetical protein
LAWDHGLGSTTGGRGLHRAAVPTCRKPEVYAGVSGSNADLPNRSRAQIVYYAGTRPTFGALLLDVGGWYIDYPGGTTFNGLGSAETCTNGAFFFGQCNTTKAVVSYFEAYEKSVLTINEALAIGDTLYYAPSWLCQTTRSGVAAATRSQVFPDVPTVGEFLPGYEASVWFGVGITAAQAGFSSR